MDISDFTPFQYPSEDPTSAWRTTYFDYHSIESNLLKLNILGHSAPINIVWFKILVRKNALDVPLDDKDLYQYSLHSMY